MPGTPNSDLDPAVGRLNSAERLEILNDLKRTPKRICDKFKYDEIGNKIFEEIMKHPKYYVANCELEILSTQSNKLVKLLCKDPSRKFDIVDLGAGDASKTSFFLQELLTQGVDFTFYPIDISRDGVRQLELDLPKKLPGIKVVGMAGDFLDMMHKLQGISSNPKVVLFLGSTIGNYEGHEERLKFLQDFGNHLQPGDLLLIGFDLVKEPMIIRDAYDNDPTRKMNFYLLDRISRELDGNVDISNFEFYSTYDPVTYTVNVYLMSKVSQKIRVGNEEIHFEEHEPLHTLISQKFSVKNIDDLAKQSGFRSKEYLYDSKRWYVNVIWDKI